MILFYVFAVVHSIWKNIKSVKRQMTHVSYLILLPNRDQISEHFPCFVCGGIIYRYLIYYCMKGYVLENQNVCLFVCLMVFNTTFNNISVISWRSVLLVEETRGPGENHHPVASHWQTLSLRPDLDANSQHQWW